MSVSDDRADGTEDREGRPEKSSDAPQPASAAARRERSGSRSVPSPAWSGGSAGKGQPTKPRGGTDTRAALPARVVRFLREVVAELRKVIWPTRKQLVTYTAVVLVFVSIMVAYVALLDMGFGEIVLYVFG
jgi:preprotein translocase subunit SecE